MLKKVLCVVSEHGFWAQELLLPVDRLETAGIQVDFVTPTGAQPFPVGGSLDSGHVDSPMGRSVTSSEMAERAQSTDWESYFKGRMNLRELFPVRPRMSAGNYIAAMESYYEGRQRAWKRLAGEYDGLLLVGGNGPIVDMVNNPRVHDLVLGFHNANKMVAAECHAVACLAFARELDVRESILAGRHCTGRAVEYDHVDGWSIMANGAPLDFGGPPFPLEYILRDAVAPGGRFHGNVGRKLSVILDFPVLTSRSVGESDLCGEVMVKALTEGLHRFGW